MKCRELSSARNAVVAALLSGAASSALLTPVAAQAGAIADALDARTTEPVITRTISLRDLGIETPLALDASAAERKLYIPVPAGVALIDPRLHFDGNYLRADGGHTTYTIAADGRVLAARSPDDDGGSAGLDVGLGSAARASGFVELGVNWASSIGQFYCDDARPIGNILEIEPDTYLQYGYRASDVKEIKTAWSALAPEVTLMVSGNHLEDASYDAAWRLGVALERDGKSVRTVALPQPGDHVDLTGVVVPDALKQVPAFSALSGGGDVKIANEAEIGALLALGAPAVNADIVVADGAMAEKLKAALDAVSAQLATADPAAGEAIERLSGALNSLGDPVDPDTVGLRSLAGRPVIAVAPDAAGAAVGLFDTLWRQSAVSGDLTLSAAAMPEVQGDSIALGALGHQSGALDVAARGDWSTTLDLAAIAPGKAPDSMDIYVSAAPGATDTRPVASVSINGYLLGARQLAADGKPERISVDIPDYALLARNVINVEFQRQPASDRCREAPQAYPAAVLPESRIWLKNAPAAASFASLSSWLSGESLVGVPQAWLANAVETLPTVMNVAEAAGISPARAAFTVAGAAVAAVPDKPFLLFDVAPDSGGNRISVTGDKIRIDSSGGERLFDAGGLSDIAAVEAVLDGGNHGLYYRSVGDGPRIEKPFRLGRGDVAVLGSGGVLTELNASGSTLYTAPGSVIEESNGLSLRLFADSKFWLERLPWLVTTLVIGGFALLLALAGLARRRERRNKE